MFDSEELRKLASYKRYSSVRVSSSELLSLLDEYERLRMLEKEVERLRNENGKLAQEMLTPEVFIRLVEWLRNPKPAVQAFTAGIERQIAYALEMDVLPEVKRLRLRLSHIDDHNCSKQESVK